MLPDQVLERYEEASLKTPFKFYVPTIIGGVISTTSKFKDFNGKDATAQYVVVEFIMDRDIKEQNGRKVLSSRDTIGFKRTISSLGSKGEKGMFNAIANLLSDEANYDKINKRQDEKGNEIFDAKLKAGYMLKFIKVKTPLHYGTRWEKGTGLVKMTKKDGSPVMYDEVEIMLEDTDEMSGDTFSTTYKSMYKSRVEPFLVIIDSEASTELPPNVKFDTESKTDEVI